MTTLFGDITEAASGYDLDFERTFETDVADLWSAVTDAARLERWLSPFTGDLSLGGTWTAHFDDGSQFAVGTVSECEPGSHFVSSWQATEEGPTIIRVFVDAVPEGARLRLRHEGVQSIFYGAGWQTYLEQLDEVLRPAASSPVDPDRLAGVDWDVRYGELRADWEQRFDQLTMNRG